MALIKFELKENHIKLLKHLSWTIGEDNCIKTKTHDDGAESPYGGLSLIEDVGLILYGQPDVKFDPLSPDGAQYTEEQIEEIELLYSELKTALEIILFLGTFEVGHYKTKWNQLNWVKYTPKS